jgi:peptidyl-dipeptidase Dcp
MKQHGGLTRENGDHFRQTLLSRGGSADALGLFKNFVGRDPYIEPLLERRGLAKTPAVDSTTRWSWCSCHRVFDRPVNAVL